jgi:hypothetical protein
MVAAEIVMVTTACPLRMSLAQRLQRRIERVWAPIHVWPFAIALAEAQAPRHDGARHD